MADLQSELLPSAVVVIAHGPTGTTLTAVNAAKRLVAPGGSIMVVAGTTVATTAVERAAERGHHVAPGHGPAALADAIRSAGDTVLVLHDDVEVLPATAAAMLRTHVLTGETVVPSSQLGRPRQQIQRTSLACVLGTSAWLADLAEIGGFTPGLSLTTEVTVAADTAHRHRGDCVHQLDGPDADDGRPLLVAAMIVRNEQEFLSDCLASLAGIVDRIEIADTGSTDDSVAIARAAGATVRSIDWRDDFAWARNQVLDRCRDAHLVLVIDADERLVVEDPAAMRRFLNTHRGGHDAYLIGIDNVERGTITHSHRLVRVIRSDARFVGAIHERPVRDDGDPLVPIELPTCRLTHVGYDAAVVAGRDKQERNLTIARESWEAEPDDIERSVHYFRELSSRLEHPKRTLAEMDRVLPDLGVVSDEVMRASLFALRGRVHLEAGEDLAALALGREAANLVPADAIAGAVAVEALVRLGRHADALDLAADLRSRPSATPATVDRLAMSTRAYALFRAAAHLGRFDECVEHAGDLAPGIDPWPALVAGFGADRVAEVAAAAGARNDARMLVALDQAAVDVRSARRRFEEAGGDLRAVDAALAERAAAADAWRGARARFAETETVQDAIAYAAAAVAGRAELDAELGELDPAGDPSSTPALALGLAAAAHQLAGRAEEAVADAVAAVELWPGAVRAAAIAANAASRAGLADVALQVIAAAHSSMMTEGRRRPAGAALLDDASVRAHLASGDLAAAAGAALDAIEANGDIDVWVDLVDAAQSDDQMLAVVLGLSVLSPGERFVAAVARSCTPARTAELCLAYTASGGPSASAVSSGILAAAVARREELALLLAEHGALLDGDLCRRLVEKLEEQGLDATARRLEEVTGLEPVGASSIGTTSAAASTLDFGAGLDGGFRIG